MFIAVSKDDTHVYSVAARIADLASRGIKVFIILLTSKSFWLSVDVCGRAEICKISLE